MAGKRIALTVTNDLNYDQRMIRICTSLTNAGYDVTLIGFERKTSKPLAEKTYKQIRIPLIAEQGKMLYAHYWYKLFWYLVRQKFDVVCANDLDTILPVYYATKVSKAKRVYDSHELFTELKEVIDRPAVLRMWEWIGSHTVHHFPVAYTIGDGFAEELSRKYGVPFRVVRNATVLRPLQIPEKEEKYVLYQGAVNIGRCFEQLIPAMQYVNARLIICGEGTFYERAQELAKEYGVEDKVVFKGYIPPAELVNYTINAWIGVTLFEDTALTHRLSLANRFFDYMHSGVPQLCIKYPEYERINAEYEVAHLVANPTPENVAEGLNKMLNDEAYYDRLQQNCLKAREKYCWQEEEKKLLDIYKQLTS
jgi:glycosyltransferase involved in cell wall biosynthesis